VQLGDRGFAEQAGDHHAGLVSLDRDARPCADLVRLRVGAQAHGVADDDALVLEARDAVGDRAARDLELVRECGHAQAGVVAQQADQLMVQGVHSSIPAIQHGNSA
jgi:hypothetical protein